MNRITDGAAAIVGQCFFNGRKYEETLGNLYSLFDYSDYCLHRVDNVFSIKTIFWKDPI